MRLGQVGHWFAACALTIVLAWAFGMAFTQLYWLALGEQPWFVAGAVWSRPLLVAVFLAGCIGATYVAVDPWQSWHRPRWGEGAAVMALTFAVCGGVLGPIMWETHGCGTDLRSPDASDAGPVCRVNDSEWMESVAGAAMAVALGAPGLAAPGMSLRAVAWLRNAPVVTASHT